MIAQGHGYRYGLVRGSRVVSRLIGRETRSDKTHGYVLTPNRQVLESVAFHGCRVRPWDEAELETTEYFEVEGRTLAQWQEVERLMRYWAKIKIGYDYRGILRWVAKFPMHINGKLFCTEEMELASKMAGDPLFRCPAQYVSPRDHDINNRLIPSPP